MPDVTIFVYGSCHFSEQLTSTDVVGTGGYGAVIVTDGIHKEISGGNSKTTNARMDIIGITRAIENVPRPSTITLYLINGNVLDTLSKGWLENWHRKGFKKVKHADLWKALRTSLQAGAHNITYRHASEARNTAEFKRAEELAKTMSGKKNLPEDIKPTSKEGLFEQASNFSPISVSPVEMEDDSPVLDSICVDASSMGNPGPTEYRGVDTKTRQVIFEMKYAEATNNIGEFLAIVHALALLKKNGQQVKVIYSDSLNAISWVRQKKCKTKFARTPANAKVFEHLDRAIAWLTSNTYQTKVLKWNTAAWGQIIADYDRK